MAALFQPPYPPRQQLRVTRGGPNQPMYQLVEPDKPAHAPNLEEACRGRKLSLSLVRDLRGRWRRTLGSCAAFAIAQQQRLTEVLGLQMSAAAIKEAIIGDTWAADPQSNPRLPTISPSGYQPPYANSLPSRIYRHLESGEEWSGPALCEAVGISDGHLRVVISRLRSRGANIHCDRGGRGTTKSYWLIKEQT